MQLHTINETAEILRISRSRVYAQIRSGKLKTVRVGKRQRVTDDAIQAFIAECTKAIEGPAPDPDPRR